MSYSTSNPPKGSYLQTCKNIEISVAAKALNKAGQEVYTTVVLPDNDHYELTNNDGVLQVVPSSTGSPGVLPNGSYLETCREVVVLMSCDAQKISGEYVRTCIDLTVLQNPDIENCDGILIDDSALNAALDEVKQIVPQYANAISGREPEIKDYMTGRYTPDQASSPIGSAAAASESVTVNGLPANNQLFGMSPCVQSCLVLLVDVFVTLLAYRAFRRSQLQAIVANAEVQQALLGRYPMVAVERLAREITNPTSAANFAEAVLEALSAVVGLSLAKAIVNAAIDELSWWDMVKFSTAMMAQAVALFSPAGPAVMYAKAVLLFVAVEGLAEDAGHVLNDCVLS